MAYSKVMHKYFLKTFYRRNRKKKYKLQILKYNICHTNIFTIQNTILLAQVKSKNKKVDINISVIQVVWESSVTNVQLKYNQLLNNIDYKTTINLGLWGVNKYWKHTAQVVDKLSDFQDFLPTLAIFMNKF